MKYILFQLKNMVIKIRTGMVFVQADLLSLNWPVGFTMFFWNEMRIMIYFKALDKFKQWYIIFLRPFMVFVTFR